MMKKGSLDYIRALCEEHKELSGCYDAIVTATDVMIECYKNGNKVLVCGNGGSASDSEHIVGELMKGFVLPRTLNEELKEKIGDAKLADALQYALPTISLVSQTSLSTAYINDQLPEAVFAQQVLGYGKKGDILICISTSGNSKNCVYAAKVARALNMKIISLTGKEESALSKIGDITIFAPYKETYKVQECHLPIYHAICLAIEEEFFGV